MIGIDTARIKRWYEKTYPTYTGTNYLVVVDHMSQTNFDQQPFMSGETVEFRVTSYLLSGPTMVHKVRGHYNRLHYGGWEAYLDEVIYPTQNASLNEDESDTNTENAGSENENSSENTDPV